MNDKYLQILKSNREKKKSQLGHDKKTLHLPGFQLQVPNKQLGGFSASFTDVLLDNNMIGVKIYVLLFIEEHDITTIQSANIIFKRR